MEWIDSLPKGRFGEVVKSALRARINGRTFEYPLNNQNAPKKDLMRKSVRLNTQTDKDILDYLDSFGRHANAEIKDILICLSSQQPISRKEPEKTPRHEAIKPPKIQTETKLLENDFKRRLLNNSKLKS